MNIVISQPMLFPWVGMLEQIRISDIYVYYSDVQFPRRGFVNRVQIKTANGIKWMTVPIREAPRDKRIDEIGISHQKNWRRQHLEMLRQAYARAPFRQDMLTLVEEVYDNDYHNIAELGEASVIALCRYFGLHEQRRFLRSADLGVGGGGSHRILGIVQALRGGRYITGWGARNYLEHDLFEKNNIRVEYMSYQKLHYPQQHGEFTPFVSALDLVANVGLDGIQCIASKSIDWKEFLKNE